LRLLTACGLGLDHERLSGVQLHLLPVVVVPAPGADVDVGTVHVNGHFVSACT
jgi:hypothetical protein